MHDKFIHGEDAPYFFYIAHTWHKNLAVRCKSSTGPIDGALLPLLFRTKVDFFIAGTGIASLGDSGNGWWRRRNGSTLGERGGCDYCH
jgi:hypothetical protein